MTDKIPEWAMAEAAFVASPELGLGLQRNIARALVSTAARVEREQRDADVALIERHDRVYAAAIRNLPLKYQEQS